MTIPLEAAKAIYRHAIDPRASDGEGEAWWAAVTDEVNQVVSAMDAATAEAVIAWWHHDWSQVAGNQALRQQASVAPRVRRGIDGKIRLLQGRPVR
ncbi:conserved protein of unknown function (plasmid) [Cupriavidus taiwanensis]|uniref:Uncharacterized protein n=1 Tax=Cupriavidus taiwanensis TaxID=164546 RepID=A0A375ISH7_9BURK|nr:hypothetical protein [Cupriavidus taiwanensis]SPK77564.1 conserved protein of unknown function [Cupriavidus taiwanensis]